MQRTFVLWALLRVQGRGCPPARQRLQDGTLSPIAAHTACHPLSPSGPSLHAPLPHQQLHHHTAPSSCTESAQKVQTVIHLLTHTPSLSPVFLQGFSVADFLSAIQDLVAREQQQQGQQQQGQGQGGQGQGGQGGSSAPMEQ